MIGLRLTVFLVAASIAVNEADFRNFRDPNLTDMSLDKKSVQQKINPDMKSRKANSFGFQKTDQSALNSPVTQSLPIFAEISPINQLHEKVGETFTGYVFAPGASHALNPFFILLCRKESNLQNQVLMKAQNELSNKMMKHLVDQITILSKFVSETIDEVNRQAKKLNPPKKKVVTKSPGSSSNNKVTKKPLRVHGGPISLSTTTAKPLYPDLDSSLDLPLNSNVQSNIFQCEGVSCPR